MSNKSVLVIDTPTYCGLCPCFTGERCDVTNKKAYYDFDERPDWCPLKPLPKMIPYKKGEATRIKWHDIGYNNCIRELRGESWKMEGETE